MGGTVLWVGISAKTRLCTSCYCHSLIPLCYPLTKRPAVVLGLIEQHQWCRVPKILLVAIAVSAFCPRSRSVHRPTVLRRVRKGQPSKKAIAPAHVISLSFSFQPSNPLPFHIQNPRDSEWRDKRGGRGLNGDMMKGEKKEGRGRGGTTRNKKRN